VNGGTLGVNSLPKTVIRQHRGCLLADHAEVSPFSVVMNVSSVVMPSILQGFDVHGKYNHKQ